MKWILTVVIAGCGLAAFSTQFIVTPAQPQVAGEVEFAEVETVSVTEVIDPASDADGDSLSYRDETELYHTNPDSNDTDHDGYLDDAELRDGYSPRHTDMIKLSMADSDNDHLSDELELALGTNLMNPDTDGDGHRDGDEAIKGFDPLIQKARAKNKHVIVDLSRQQLDYYVGNVKLGTINVSTGTRQTPTPVGEFAIERKLPSVLYRGPDYYFPNTKWNLQFKPSYYLHGAYWHNDFGKRPRSHGCINIAYKDVEKLYEFLDVGDQVTIIGETPIGYVKK